MLIFLELLTSNLIPSHSKFILQKILLLLCWNKSFRFNLFPLNYENLTIDSQIYKDKFYVQLSTPAD